MLEQTPQFFRNILDQQKNLIKNSFNTDFFDKDFAFLTWFHSLNYPRKSDLFILQIVRLTYLRLSERVFFGNDLLIRRPSFYKFIKFLPFLLSELFGYISLIIGTLKLIIQGSFTSTKYTFVLTAFAHYRGQINSKFFNPSLASHAPLNQKDSLYLVSLSSRSTNLLFSIKMSLSSQHILIPSTLRYFAGVLGFLNLTLGNSQAYNEICSHDFESRRRTILNVLYMSVGYNLTLLSFFRKFSVAKSFYTTFNYTPISYAFISTFHELSIDTSEVLHGRLSPECLCNACWLDEYKAPIYCLPDCYIGSQSQQSIFKKLYNHATFFDFHHFHAISQLPDPALFLDPSLSSKLSLFGSGKKTILIILDAYGMPDFISRIFRDEAFAFILRPHPSFKHNIKTEVPKSYYNPSIKIGLSYPIEAFLPLVDAIIVSRFTSGYTALSSFKSSIFSYNSSSESVSFMDFEMLPNDLSSTMDLSAFLDVVRDSAA